MAGFTLTRVPENSLLTEAGLRAGDVLTQINDIPIDSMATLDRPVAEAAGREHADRGRSAQRTARFTHRELEVAAA